MSTNVRSNIVRYVLPVAFALAACADTASDAGSVGVLRQPFQYPLVLEAEEASGGGVVEADATASGGQLLALTVVGTVAEKAFTTNGSIVGGTVRVRADACSVFPSLELLVDGVPRSSGAVTRQHWAERSFAVPMVAPGDHTLALRYRDGANGCALRIDSVTLTIDEPPPPPPPVEAGAPVTVEAESATGRGIVETDATASGGQVRAFSLSGVSATASFTATGSLTGGSVRVRSEPCTTPPALVLRVDGSPILETVVPQTSWTDLPFGGFGIAAGSHTVTFFVRSAACGLLIDKVTFTPN